MHKVSIILCLALATLSSMAGTEKSQTLYDFSTETRKRIVSIAGTTNKLKFLKHNMLPIGSAALTNSGTLNTSGIKGIIHAASGSMTKHVGIFKPSLFGVTQSIINAIDLANKSGHKGVAIPFIGSGIFLSSINLSKDELAKNIIETALKANNKLSLSFIAYSNEDYNVLKTAHKNVTKDLNKKTKSNVLKGSITDFKLHKKELIINAANTELIFGAGLSGFIGRKSGEANIINSDGQNIIMKLKEIINK